MGAWDELSERCAPERGWAVDCYLGGREALRTGTVIDDALGGGLMPGITLLGGQASSGKSALACHAAANVAARGGRVLYMTLDDSWGNVVARCMSAWSVTAARSWGGEPFSWSGLAESRRALRPWRTSDPTRDAFQLRERDPALMASAHWEDGPARSLAVVDDVGEVGEVERIVSGLTDDGEAPALVVVDYVQQWSTGDPETDRSEYARVSAVVSRLQRLALWGGVPVLCVSSLRKLDRKDDEPTLDWFRGSSQLGYAAWAALILTRGEREGAGWREVEIHTVKNKGGRAGMKSSYALWGGYSWTGEMPD